MDSVIVSRLPRDVDAAHKYAGALHAISRRKRFEGLLERHEPRLRRVAFGMLADPSRVDDVLQESFVRAYRSLPTQFESDGHEAAWLYRIVYRSCLNEVRSVRRRREVSGLPDDAVAGGGVSEESLVVAAALQKLPSDLRAVVLLVDLLGFDYETTASALEVPRGTVASRLNAARRLLREELGDDDA